MLAEFANRDLCREISFQDINLPPLYSYSCHNLTVSLQDLYFTYDCSAEILADNAVLFDRPAISVVIPCYNEEKRLGPVLEKTIRYLRRNSEPYEIIIVDDGSTDSTASVAEWYMQLEPAVRLIKSGANFGKGHAVREGILESRGDLVLFQDADGSVPVDQFGKLRDRLLFSDIAVGSRRINSVQAEYSTPLYRRIAGSIFNFLTNMIVDTGMRDTQCGFKLFNRYAALDIFSQQSLDGFSFDVEALRIADKKGYSISEVPVDWHNEKGSKVRIVRDSIRMFADLIRIRMLHG